MPARNPKGILNHPDSEAVHKAVRALVVEVSSYSATLYRVCETDYATQPDLLSGEGSKKCGGRWNIPGGARTVYLSTSLNGALDETLGVSSKYGWDPADRLPVTLVAVDVKVRRALDITSAKVRRRLGITIAAMVSADWKSENRQGRETISQCLGRAAVAEGIQAIVVPSAARRGVINVNVFADLLGKGDMLRARHAEKLPISPMRSAGRNTGG